MRRLSAEHREKLRAAWARRRALLPPKPPKPPKVFKPDAGGLEERLSAFVPYKKISAVSIESRGRIRAVTLHDDGKGNRTRRTSRRWFATSAEARAAAERMRAREETL